MSDGMGSFRSGTYTGTGAAQNVSLGFIPDVIWVTNVTDGDAAFMVMLNADETAYITNAIGDAASVADAFSPFAGTEGGVGAGFSIGTSAVANESGDVFRYVAQRGQTD
ncbi:MAG: hypothetical protein AAF416_14385 [Pseudomonadota bacterium]